MQHRRVRANNPGKESDPLKHMAIRDRPIRVHLQMEHREVEDAPINRLSLQQMAKSLTQIIPKCGRKEANIEDEASQRRHRSLSRVNTQKKL